MAIQDQGIASITPSIGAAGITSTSPTLQSVVPKQTIDQTVDYLKKVPFEYLRSEMTNPTGDIPIYLVAAETSRRLNETKRAQMPVPPTSTVADKLLEESGIMSPVAQRAPMPSEMPMQFSNGGEVFAPVYGEGMGFGRPEDEFGNTSALANTLTSQDFRRLIEDVARERGLTLEQAADLVAMGTQESNLNPYSPVGSAGEIGGMQVKPSTAADPGPDSTAFGDESELAAYNKWQREFAETQGRNPEYGEKVEWIGSNMPRTATMLENPRNNVDTATAYYQGLLSRYDGDRDKAIAAYNQGPGAIDKIAQEAQINGRPFLEVLEEANPEGYAYLTSVNKNLSDRPEATVDYPEGPSLEEAVEEKEKVDRERELELERERIREKERIEQEERDREKRYTPDEIIISDEPPKKDAPEAEAEAEQPSTATPGDVRRVDQSEKNVKAIREGEERAKAERERLRKLQEDKDAAQEEYSTVEQRLQKYLQETQDELGQPEITYDDNLTEVRRRFKEAGLDKDYTTIDNRLKKRGADNEKRLQYFKAMPFFAAARAAIQGGDQNILETVLRVGGAAAETYGQAQDLIRKDEDDLMELQLLREEMETAQSRFEYGEVEKLRNEQTRTRERLEENSMAINLKVLELDVLIKKAELDAETDALTTAFNRIEKNISNYIKEWTKANPPPNLSELPTGGELETIKRIIVQQREDLKDIDDLDELDPAELDEAIKQIQIGLWENKRRQAEDRMRNWYSGPSQSSQ